MKIDVGAQTDVGQARERNEDGFLVEEPLYAVADGMGGHRAGEVASRMALEAIGEVPTDDGAHSLPERVRAANRIVFQRSSEDADVEGMGTTLTALVMDGDEARIAHVGDSRAYLLRDGELRMLTEDHTLVQRMVREGKITREEADHHPQRSILTRALGVEDEVDVDELTVPLRAGDRVLLCTDGLTSMIDEERIAGVLRQEADPQGAADRLVEAANEAGGQDNITVVVLDVDGGPTAAAPAGAAAESTSPAAPVAAGPQAPDEGGAIAPGADDTLVTSREDLRQPASAGADDDWRGSDTPRRRGWVRGLVIGLAILVVAGVAGKLYVDRQWFVGIHEGNVAIFRGIPEDFLGVSLSSLEEETDLPAAEAEALRPGLEDGITVADRAEAEEIVALIRQDLERQEDPPQQGSPTPGGSPTSSPGGG